MSKIKQTITCACGWDIPVDQLDTSKVLPDSSIGIASCSACGAAYWHFHGPDKDERLFDQFLEDFKEQSPEVRRRLIAHINSSRV